MSQRNGGKTTFAIPHQENWQTSIPNSNPRSLEYNISRKLQTNNQDKRSLDPKNRSQKLHKNPRVVQNPTINITKQQLKPMNPPFSNLKIHTQKSQGKSEHQKWVTATMVSGNRTGGHVNPSTHITTVSGEGRERSENEGKGRTKLSLNGPIYRSETLQSLGYMIKKIIYVFLACHRCTWQAYKNQKPRMLELYNILNWFV